MSVVHSLKQFVFSNYLWNILPFGKNKRELGYWRENIERMKLWYSNEGDYYFPNPTFEEKIKEFDQTQNAILTFINALLRKCSYLKDLQLEKDHFKDKIVADIGSGPMPTLLMFEDCEERICVDHLINEYQKLGYPHSHFKDDVEFNNSKSEDIKLQDNSVDAVISVNALGHVDNFAATAKEIQRILKPGGEIHLLINLHPTKTSTETQSLTREDVFNAFSKEIGLKEKYSMKKAYGFEDGESVLFSNAA